MIMKKLLYGAGIAIALMITSTNAQAQTVKEETKVKKGWSKKAKYATIGAGAGAATGVVTSKNDSKGAIVGGAVGAGAGYLYGRHKDKKNPTRKTVYKTKKTVE
jgi:hypothetical protein